MHQRCKWHHGSLVLNINGKNVENCIKLPYVAVSCHILKYCANVFLSHVLQKYFLKNLIALIFQCHNSSMLFQLSFIWAYLLLSYKRDWIGWKSL